MDAASPMQPPPPASTSAALAGIWASFEAFGKSAKPREQEGETEEGKGRERGKIKARRKGRRRKGRGGFRLYHFDAKVSALRSPGPPPLAWGLCSP